MLITKLGFVKPSFVAIYSYVGGSDYIAGPYNITIAPGLIRVPFIVNISKDYELDDSEYFNLAIVQTRLLSSNRVTLGSPNQTEVIIIDNAGE